MNPGQHQSVFVLRRLTESFDNWYIGLPILFALTVLFIIACLRREKIGTLAWGLCFIVFGPALVIASMELRGVGGWGGNLAWGCSVLLCGLLSTGFIVNLIREATGWKHPLVWMLALVVFPASIALAVFDVIPLGEKITPIALPLDLKITPIIVLFLAQVVVSVLRAGLRSGLWIGLIVIALGSGPYIYGALLLKPLSLPRVPDMFFSWTVVLLPILIVAFFYIGMMYFKDSASIHPIWATFLGLLRVTVYAILVFVFLLPGCQHWDPTEVVPKNLIVFDVSGSMVNHSDVLPDPAKKGQPRPTRQDKVVEFWTTAFGPDKHERPAFLDRILEKSPATFYRFGPIVDHHKSSVPTFPMLTDANRDQLWTAADLQRYLKPDKKNIVMPEIVLSPEDQKKPKSEQQAEIARRLKEQKDERPRLEDMVDLLLHGGTDVYGSVRDVARAESSNYVQAIIVFSDGTSNLGSSEALLELQRRANNPLRPISIYTVLVGNYQQPTEIRNIDVQTAETARPDDRFPLKIFVSASASLRDEPFDVFLEAIRKKDASGKALPNEKKYVYPVRKGQFKGQGENPQDSIDYQIDLLQLVVAREQKERPEYRKDLVEKLRSTFANEPKPIPVDNLKDEELKTKFIEHFGIGLWESAAVKLLLEQHKIDVAPGTKLDDMKKKFLDAFGVGEWEFTAVVPRHPKESTEEAVHRSNPPTRVLVQNRELRILLFAGGPSRDYQFVRALFEKEMLEKRIQMSVFLQTAPRGDGIDQGVPADRLLAHFPNKLGLDDPTDKFSSLNMYDVVIAFDPDWTALDAEQLKNLKQWVSRDGGGVVFVAGPVYSQNLARIREDFRPLREILPVTLLDHRSLPLGKHVDATRTYALHFTPAARDFDFLKLDEAGDSKTAGWNKFFWGHESPPEAGRDETPVRGMHSFYPVEELQPTSIVLATFAGPKNSFMNDKDETPYLVTMPVGSGKTVYIGSAETWALRTCKESFHDRFWIRLARFAAGGGGQQKRYGRILTARKAQVGVIPVEAQIKGADLKPLPDDARPTLLALKRGDLAAKPLAFELRARPTKGDWQGWFAGKIKLTEPGEYELTINIDNVSEPLSQRIVVDSPSLEMGDLRENARAMWDLATDAAPVLFRLDKETKAKVLADLQPLSEEARGDRTGQRLFFTLDKADDIPLCLLKKEPIHDRVKGSWEDLWDVGSTTYSIPQYLIALIGWLVLGLVIAAILFAYRRWILGVIVLMSAGAVPAATCLIGFFVSGSFEWVLAGSKEYALPHYLLLLVVPFAVCALGVAIALFHRLWILAGIIAVLAFLLPAVAYFACSYWLGPDWMQAAEKLDFAFVMAAVVSLLAIEWLTRKLLKLA